MENLLNNLKDLAFYALLWIIFIKNPNILNNLLKSFKGGKKKKK